MAQHHIKSFLKTIQENKHWYIISIVFDNSAYFRRMNKINHLYHRLSNSKATLTGNPSNRSWWNLIKPSGIYLPVITANDLSFNFILSTELKINELEFKSRVKKICPYVSIKIGYRDINEMEKITEDHYYTYQQNIVSFGNNKRNKPDYIKN